MEKLYAYAFMYISGFDVYTDFETELDREFLENPGDPVLLDLECAHGRKDLLLKTIHAFTVNSINIDRLGRVLAELLHKEYRKTDLVSFGRKTFALWNALPNEIAMTDPFHLLSYADDPLSYGDVQASREIYQKLFAYYQ